MKELVVFLDELAYGPQGTPGVSEQRREWREQLDGAVWLTSILPELKERSGD
jgi:hypothetical protein